MTAHISQQSQYSQANLEVRYQTEIALCEYFFENRRIKFSAENISERFNQIPCNTLRNILDTLADAQIIFSTHDGSYRWQCEQTLEGAKSFIRRRYQRGNQTSA